MFQPKVHISDVPFRMISHKHVKSSGEFEPDTACQIKLSSKTTNSGLLDKSRKKVKHSTTYISKRYDPLTSVSPHIISPLVSILLAMGVSGTEMEGVNLTTKEIVSGDRSYSRVETFTPQKLHYSTKYKFSVEHDCQLSLPTWSEILTNKNARKQFITFYGGIVPGLFIAQEYDANESNIGIIIRSGRKYPIKYDFDWSLVYNNSPLAEKYFYDLIGLITEYRPNRHNYNVYLPVKSVGGAVSFSHMITDYFTGKVNKNFPWAEILKKAETDPMMSAGLVEIVHRLKIYQYISLEEINYMFSKEKFFENNPELCRTLDGRINVEVEDDNGDTIEYSNLTIDKYLNLTKIRFLKNLNDLLMGFGPAITAFENGQLKSQIRRYQPHVYPKHWEYLDAAIQEANRRRISLYNLRKERELILNTALSEIHSYNFSNLQEYASKIDINTNNGLIFTSLLEKINFLHSNILKPREENILRILVKNLNPDNLKLAIELTQRLNNQTLVKFLTNSSPEKKIDMSNVPEILRKHLAKGTMQKPQGRLI